jgi:hypothetical protein
MAGWFILFTVVVGLEEEEEKVDGFEGFTTK